MSYWFYVPVALIGYLIGCSNMALYISRLKGIDLQKAGSGNLGASNAMMIMGWKAGVAVGIHDIGKGIVAVLLARYFCGELPLIGAVAGVACVLGHIFPFYLRFKGGKGLAAYLGMTVALNWRLAIIVGLLIVLITLITDYIALGTVTTVIVVPAYLGASQHSVLLLAVLMIATAVILFKHRDNYRRILAGTEMGLRRANRGDFRQKGNKNDR